MNIEKVSNPLDAKFVGKYKEVEAIEERGKWSGKLDFILSCLGYAVGLGNVWRFPYLCFKHGGAAFLIPYCVMLFAIGIPMFFLEISIGQYSALGPVDVYSHLSPLFSGLGFANVLCTTFLVVYYNIIVAYTIYYLFASFNPQLPWDGCDSEFNTPFCFDINDYKECVSQRESGNISSDSIYFFGRCLNTIDDNSDFEKLRKNISFYYECKNKTDAKEEDYLFGDVFLDENGISCGSLEDFPKTLFDIPKILRSSAAEEYYDLGVIRESDGLDNMGPVQWKLCLCLMAAWFLVFLCLIKGIKSSGKVVYFTATLPFLILFIFFCKAVTLPGAYSGIEYFIKPDLSKLANIKVWEAAAIQIFFSLSIAGGTLITLASYNDFKNNIIRDTIIVSFGNAFTSIFAGFTVFSILGFMAHEMGVTVPDVVKSGSGLAFIVFPDLVTLLPLPNLWALLFFIMLLALGLDTQFAMVETIMTAILDFAPQLRPKRTLVIAILCTFLFLSGIVLTTPGGGYLVDFLDYYALTWPFLFICFCELVIVAHIHGMDNFINDVKKMVTFDIGKWTMINFQFIYMTLAPAIILAILIFSWASHEPLTKGDYVYPSWTNGIGWTIAMIHILAVPLVAIVKYILAIYQNSKADKFNFSTDAFGIFKDLIVPTETYGINAQKSEDAIELQDISSDESDNLMAPETA
jgi:solute carrier family 6 amino acid transporter-like protein 5/7/9/14